MEAPMAVPEVEGCSELPEYRPLHGDASGDAIPPAGEATVWEAELREVYYSWAGGFDQVLGSDATLAALSPITALGRLQSQWELGALAGSNSLLIMGPSALRYRLGGLTSLAQKVVRTRIVVKVCDGGPAESRLRALGWKLVRRVGVGRPQYAEGTAPAQMARGCSWGRGAGRREGS
jgi:hypothetical protein